MSESFVPDTLLMVNAVLEVVRGKGEVSEGVRRAFELGKLGSLPSKHADQVMDEVLSLVLMTQEVAMRTLSANHLMEVAKMLDLPSSVMDALSEAVDELR